MFWAITLMSPVPGSRESSEAPTPSDSSFGTWAEIDSWASSWSFESMVVRMVRPPRSSRAWRDFTSGPKAGFARI